MIAAPKEFDVANIEKEISWDNINFKQISILKWKAEDDESPCYIGSAEDGSPLSQNHFT